VGRNLQQSAIREMTNDQSHVPARWLWDASLGLMALALAGGLALIVALALGWNSPCPTRPPDWEAPDLPLYLKAPPNETTMSLLGHPGSDFILEVEAVPLSGPAFNGYGLVYRAQGPAHYYAFAVGSDGYYAVLRVAGDEETPLVDWQQFPHVHRGRQANRLRVTCTSATCRFYVNDEYATAVEDDTHLAGGVGLWVRGFGDGDVAVQFVNVRVWGETERVQNCWLVWNYEQEYNRGRSLFARDTGCFQERLVR